MSDIKLDENLLISKINEESGFKSASFLSDLDLKFLPTRSRLFNVFLSNRRDGGIIYGRDGITLISGEPSTGKTLLAAEISRSVQDAGGIVVYLDSEHAVNKDFFKKIGVNIDKLIIVDPESLENGFKIIENTIFTIRESSSEKNVVIIWDSIAATISSYEQEDQSYDPQNSIGVAARIMSKALRKINPIISRNNISIIFTNQLRKTISNVQYGDTDSEYGGKALQYYASTKVKLRRVEYIKNKEGVVAGSKVKFTLVKSRVGSPMKEIVFRIYNDSGIDDILTLKDQLDKFGFIKTAGAWSTLEVLGEQVKFRGDDEFKQLITSNKDLLERCYTLVEDKLIY